MRLVHPAPFPHWLIPSLYIVASVGAGLILPRLERTYLPGLVHQMSADSAIASFSAIASGSMAFTAMIFSVAFVVVQFSAVAYSPRLVVLFAGKAHLYHTLGLFFATFTFSLAALIWTDRNGSGAAPVISAYVVAVLLIASMLAFARLIHSIQELQIQNVLQAIGSRGRAVIAAMFPAVAADDADAPEQNGVLADLPPLRRVFTYAGAPLAVASVDLERLVAAARASDSVIVVDFAVGDTLQDGAVLFRVRGGQAPIAEAALRRTVRLATSRTFEQDPKYAIRLLVDVAIRALSPAVNDPTTAVQALDQIEDLLGRLGRSRLGAGSARDQDGVIRAIIPTPTWEDYVSLSFDEIRQFGAASVQVARRLRAALNSLAVSIPVEQRRQSVRQYLEHLDAGLRRSAFDEQDRASGMREDRQGLGLGGRRPAL